MPSQPDMLADTEKEMQKQWDKGNEMKKAHLLGVDQVKFYFCRY